MSIQLRRGANVVLIVLAIAVPAAAETDTGLHIPDSWSNVERWAWDEIRAGRIADFNQRYNKEPVPDPKQPEGWDEDRRLSQDFLKTILMREPFRSAVPDEGVRIIGAWLPERIDLAEARLRQQLRLDKCRSDGGVNLSGATVGGVLSMIGSRFKGVTMDSLEVKSHLDMYGATFEGDVNLNNATVGGVLGMIRSRFKDVTMDSLEVKSHHSMYGATFEGDVNLNNATVGGVLSMIRSRFKDVTMDKLQVKSSLFMRGGATFEGDVNLTSAAVGGTLDMDGSRFKGVTMDKLQVKSSLSMSDGATFEGNVNLSGAAVGGTLDMDGSRFKGVTMDKLQVKSSLSMSHGATFEGDVNLSGAAVGGVLGMVSSNFESGFRAERLHVGGHMLLQYSTFAREPRIFFGHVGGGFNLAGAKLPGLDLFSTVIVSDLSLDDPPPEWRKSARLKLRNVHVGALQAAGSDAWPRPSAHQGSLDLQGFVYDRLGSYGSGSDTQAMLLREASWYVDWLERDQTFTRQPYQQLAAVFRAAGDSNRADAVLYAARDRELAENWREGRCRYGLGLVLLKGECWDAVGLGLLKISIGYGLGRGFFLILVWVVVFTAIGVVVLWFSPAARAKGLLWCLGASLDHLLPTVELNKEFTDFFNDPGRQQLSGRQLAYFAVQALIGYVLAFFVVAGLAGLTQAR